MSSERCPKCGCYLPYCYCGETELEDDEDDEDDDDNYDVLR